MDSSTYRHLLGQLNKNSGISHCSFPSHNLLSLETLLGASQDLNSDALDGGPEFLANFPCYQSFPFSSDKFSVLFCGSGITDYATQLVKRKMDWERKLKGLRVSNINSAVKHIQEVRKNKAHKLSRNLRRYIDHFHNDPEPMFSGKYNWLYSGGCLSYNEEYDGITLISGDFFTTKPGFNILKLNDTLKEVQEKSSCQLKAHSPVFQITCKSHQENLIICARQKNYISLFNKKNTPCEFHPVKLWRKKVVGSKLLTSVDIKENCEEIIVTDSNHDMHVFHTDRKEKVYCHSGKKIAHNLNRDSWSQVAFGELGVYWAFKNCFSVLDLRDFSSGAKLVYDPASATNKCDKMCSFVKGPSDPNFVYLGTTHNVLQMDLRMGRPVQRWTHLMKNPPQFMTATKVEERGEVVILQSQAVSEILGIVNERTDDSGNVHFISKSLPCLLESMKGSLKLAHFNGLCLSPFITKRVNFAVTGVQCLKNRQGEVILFTTNSGGDVFQSKLRKKMSEYSTTAEDERQVLDTMKTYESHCENLPSPNWTSHHLQFTDMKHLLKEHDPSKVKAKMQRKVEIHWKYEEMYSPDSLKMYKDVLAQKILKVWGHSPEESEQPMSVDSKVREWMDNFTE